MVLDGLHREVETNGDLVVGQPLCDEAEHFGLALGETADFSRLIHSSPDGTYYVQNSFRLDEAVDQLQQRNVGMVRTDASVLDPKLDHVP